LDVTIVAQLIANATNINIHKISEHKRRDIHFIDNNVLESTLE